MTLGDKLKWSTYPSDDGNLYGIKQYGAVQTASGLAATTRGALRAWPYHTSDLRHICGTTADGLHSARLVTTAADTRFVNSTGSFTLYGKTYVVTGSEGERRPGTHLA